MEKLIEKITSYDLFNNLLPGVIFVTLLSSMTVHTLTKGDIVVDVFIYYLAGTVVSRMGSFIESAMKFIELVVFEDYPKYLAACKVDPKIEVLLEKANSYRTFTALFLIVGVIKFYDYFGVKYSLTSNTSHAILLILLFSLFLFSYRKQVEYMTQRIRFNNKNDVE